MRSQSWKKNATRWRLEWYTGLSVMAMLGIERGKRMLA
jgi:hypothetical protein